MIDPNWNWLHHSPLNVGDHIHQCVTAINKEREGNQFKRKDFGCKAICFLAIIFNWFQQMEVGSEDYNFGFNEITLA